MKWGECIYYLGMSDGGSGGFYCICCGIFRKQTKYITDGDKQNDDSIVQAAATGMNLIFFNESINILKLQTIIS